VTFSRSRILAHACPPHLFSRRKHAGTGISLEYREDASFFKRVDAETTAHSHAPTTTALAAQRGSNEAPLTAQAASSSTSSSSGSNDDDGDDGGGDSDDAVDIYVGNLPFACDADGDEDELRALLARVGNVELSSIDALRVNYKRNFAFATVPAAAARRLVKASSASSDALGSTASALSPLLLRGRAITVAQRGSSSLKRLADALSANGFPPARYNVHVATPTSSPAAAAAARGGDADVGADADVTADDHAAGEWTGTASVQGLGLVACVSSKPTRKDVREYLATALLRMIPAAASDSAQGDTPSSEQVQPMQPTIVAEAVEAVDVSGSSASPRVSRAAPSCLPRVLTVNLIDSPGHVDFNAEVRDFVFEFAFAYAL
jgi:hypothetical protein